MLKVESQAQFDAMVKDGVFSCNEGVEFTFNLITEADIIVKGDIDARNINAGNIKAWNIDAWDIFAENIRAGDVSFYAVCFAYKNIVCKSIEGRRENSKYLTIDGKVVIG